MDNTGFIRKYIIEKIDNVPTLTGLTTVISEYNMTQSFEIVSGNTVYTFPELSFIDFTYLSNEDYNFRRDAFFDFLNIPLSLRNNLMFESVTFDLDICPTTTTTTTTTTLPPIPGETTTLPPPTTTMPPATTTTQPPIVCYSYSYNISEQDLLDSDDGKVYIDYFNCDNGQLTIISETVPNLSIAKFFCNRNSTGLPTIYMFVGGNIVPANLSLLTQVTLNDEPQQCN